MVEVKFSKQWRGHDPGTVVELTDARAAELIGQGFCCATASKEKPVIASAEVEPQPIPDPEPAQKPTRGRKQYSSPETTAKPSETT